MRDRFTISDLARMFGGKPRSFQLWSDRGVIEPLPETKMKGPRMRFVPTRSVERFDLQAMHRLRSRLVRVIADLSGDLRHLDERLDEVTAEIQALAKADDACQRMITVPGIGPVIAGIIEAGDTIEDVGEFDPNFQTEESPVVISSCTPKNPQSPVAGGGPRAIR